MTDITHSPDDLTLYDPDFLYQPSPSSPTFDELSQHSPQDQTEEYMLQCTICASMAEQALVKASNTQQPLACWGCGSLEHLLSNCPLRSQP